MLKTGQEFLLTKDLPTKNGECSLQGQGVNAMADLCFFVSCAGHIRPQTSAAKMSQ